MRITKLSFDQGENISTPSKMPQFMLRLKLNPNTCTTIAEGGAEILWCFCSCMVVFIQIEEVCGIMPYSK